MGSHIESWDGAAGAIYMGANTGWELVWVGVAALLCVIALVSGSRHELDAYRKLKAGKITGDDVGHT